MLAIVAEPAEKPDARLLALDSHSPSMLVSQRISLDHLALIITPSNDLKIHARFVGINRGLVEDRKAAPRGLCAATSGGLFAGYCYQLLVNCED